MSKTGFSNLELTRLKKYALPDWVIDKGRRYVFSPDEYICFEGDDVKTIHFILDGKAKASLLAENGKQRLLCYYLSDGIIGDVEWILERPDIITNVEAITSFTTFGIHISDATKLKDDARFMGSIAKELAQKLIVSDQNSVIAMLHSPIERLHVYMSETSRDGFFDEKLVDVAQILSMSYRHMLRCLKKLSEQGMIEKTKSGYKILIYPR